MKSLIDIVPADWSTHQVRFFSDTYSGGTPLRSNESFYSGDINWVKSSELKSKFLYKTEEHITEEAIKKSSARWVNSNTILFAMYGATAGDLCILMQKSTTNQAVLAIPVNKEPIENEYLYYALMYKTQKLKFITQGGGQPNLSKGIVDKTPISHPKSSSEQTAIAGILSKVDEAIEAVEDSIKAAERLKKSLMQNLLTGKLKPDGTWRSEDEFYVDDKFGKVPKGWTVKRLKDLILFHQYGMNISSSESGTIPMFRMNNIIDGRMVDSPMVMVTISDSDFKKYKVEKGDIFFNRTNSLDLVGKIGIFYMDGDYVFASYLIRIRATEDNVPEYLNYYLNSYKGQTSLRAKATPAVSQANINAKSLVQTYVPRPPKETQTEIVQLIKSHEDLKLEHTKKLQTLQTLKKSLMQNLLTGKIRVDVEKINTILEEV